MVVDQRLHRIHPCHDFACEHAVDSTFFPPLAVSEPAGRGGSEPAGGATAGIAGLGVPERGEELGAPRWALLKGFVTRPNLGAPR